MNKMVAISFHSRRNLSYLLERNENETDEKESLRKLF